MERIGIFRQYLSRFSMFISSTEQLRRTLLWESLLASPESDVSSVLWTRLMTSFWHALKLWDTVSVAGFFQTNMSPGPISNSPHRSQIKTHQKKTDIKSRKLVSVRKRKCSGAFKNCSSLWCSIPKSFSLLCIVEQSIPRKFPDISVTCSWDHKATNKNH